MPCDLKTEKPISAIDPQKRDMLQELKALGEKYDIMDIFPLKTREISVARWVRLKCKYGCRNYAKNWCCPPESPTPEQTRALLGEYREALLIISKTKNNQFYRNNQNKRRVQVNSWKGTVALERWLFLAGYYKAFSLVSETCALCRECAYPDECLFPMERRPSVESCSIDIFQTLKNVGQPFKLALNLEEEYHCYSIILQE